jgi:hypothetical protein
VTSINVINTGIISLSTGGVFDIYGLIGDERESYRQMECFVEMSIAVFEDKFPSQKGLENNHESSIYYD